MKRASPTFWGVFSAHRLLSRAVILAAIAVVTTACEDDVYVIDGPSNCRVRGNSVFIANAFFVQHTLPHKCPLMIFDPTWPPQGRGEWYEAVETVPVATGVPENTIVYTNIYDAAGGNKRAMENPLARWNETLRADISGTYNAGSVPPGCLGCVLSDRAYQTVEVPGSSGGIATAEVQIPYRQAYLASTGGPGNVNEGDWFTVEVSVSSTARQPVEYEWFIDGQSTGPPTQGASSFSDYGHAANTYQRYEVLVTDAEGGQVWTAAHVVRIDPVGSNCGEVDECPPE